MISIKLAGAMPSISGYTSWETQLVLIFFCWSFLMSVLPQYIFLIEKQKLNGHGVGDGISESSSAVNLTSFLGKCKRLRPEI